MGANYSEANTFRAFREPEQSVSFQFSLFYSFFTYSFCTYSSSFFRLVLGLLATSFVDVLATCYRNSYLIFTHYHSVIK